MKKRFIVLESGEQFEITAEKGKYYICKNTMFRKANPLITVVEKETSKPKAKAKTKIEKDLEAVILGEDGALLAEGIEKEITEEIEEVEE